MYKDNDFRFSVIANLSLETGKIVNAISHALVGLSAEMRRCEAAILEYSNEKLGIQSSIARWPIIVLGAKNSGQIRSAHRRASSLGLRSNAFLSQMFGESAEVQQAQVSSALEEDLEYVALALFGPSDTLKTVTGSFGLLKRFKEHNDGGCP